MYPTRRLSVGVRQSGHGGYRLLVILTSGHLLQGVCPTTNVRCVVGGKVKLLVLSWGGAEMIFFGFQNIGRFGASEPLHAPGFGVTSGWRILYKREGT